MSDIRFLQWCCNGQYSHADGANSSSLDNILLLRHILENVLLIQEMVDWAKCLKQNIFLLKLDFRKAYDNVILLLILDSPLLAN
jgi:hypothetical protein